jgi:hypothetical protein
VCSHDLISGAQDTLPAAQAAESAVPEAKPQPAAPLEDLASLGIIEDTSLPAVQPAQTATQQGDLLKLDDIIPTVQLPTLILSLTVALIFLL